MSIDSQMVRLWWILTAGNSIGGPASMFTVSLFDAGRPKFWGARAIAHKFPASNSAFIDESAADYCQRGTGKDTHRLV